MLVFFWGSKLSSDIALKADMQKSVWINTNDFEKLAQKMHKNAKNQHKKA